MCFSSFELSILLSDTFGKLLLDSETTTFDFLTISFVDLGYCGNKQTRFSGLHDILKYLKNDILLWLFDNWPYFKYLILIFRRTEDRNDCIAQHWFYSQQPTNRFPTYYLVQCSDIATIYCTFIVKQLQIKIAF